MMRVKLSMRPNQFRIYYRLLKRKERFTEAKDAPRVMDPEMAEKLAKRAKRFEALAV